jgi:ATP-grasp domain, R2K clade family 3
MLLLVPADPLTPRQPDAHFAPEADAARALGLAVAVVDHDALSRPGQADQAVRQVPNAQADHAVYRGWMLRSEHYDAFARALATRGVRLRTSPAAYRAAHEFPGWYRAFQPHTPRSLWTNGPSLEQVAACAAQLGPAPAVLRDYVKSAKHAWDEAAYLPNPNDHKAVARVARRLVELRDDDFVGGFVVRAFERFTGAEVRSWWVDGACKLLTAHPDTPEAAPPVVDTGPFAAAVATLGAPFVTVDLARRADGVWRVVEVGDGQVSDRPSSMPPDEFLAALTG